MKIQQQFWPVSGGGPLKLDTGPNGKAQLALVFGGRGILENPETFRQLRVLYPSAILFGCSTAGEIGGTRLSDDSLVVTAIEFSATRLKGVLVEIKDSTSSFACGAQLAESLPKEELVHVLVLSDGTLVNGSELLRGILSKLPPSVQVTGGLSGDGAQFKKTLVFLDTPAKQGCIAALGFYGSKLKVGYGSLGGWDPYGPERIVTRSKANILYELDGQEALTLYKKYLGKHASGLPATALLFPLNIRTKDGREFVRTVLSVNEADKSLTFAGNLPQESYARFMKANFDRLVDGALGAARISNTALGQTAELGILISCVGRKLVLQQRTEEELEAVREVLGASAVLTGFYSYGEICPVAPNANCELHNQTMTVTTFSETA